MADRVGFKSCACLECEGIRCRILDQIERFGSGALRVSMDMLFQVDIGDELLAIPVDLLILDGERPALLVECVAGHLAVRERAALAKARLLPEGPVPLVMVANDRDAVMVEVERGKEIGFGLDALASVLEAGFGRWRNPPKPSPEGMEREKRVLATYGRFGCGGARDPS